MPIYLKDIPLEEALRRLDKALQKIGQWGVLGVEEILLDEKAVGRVLAEPVWAKISSPHYHAAAMDGFAVRSADTAGAMPTYPITLTYGSQAMYLDTGDALPTWADAVIPIENIESLDKRSGPAQHARRPFAIRIRSGISPWSHVRSMGEDMVATQLVLPAGHTMRPVDVGAVAACGHASIRVSRKPKVAIIPTGSELVPVGHAVKPGEIIEFNSIVLAAQIYSWGGEATRYPIVSDDFDEIRKQVSEIAQDYDLILLNAGSSAGSEDFSARVVESLGELYVHGVAVRPGHPVIIGVIGEKTQRPIIGVPGYPVSSALTGEIFVEPLLARWLGRAPFEPVEIRATITRKTTSPAGDDDYLRVAVGRVGERVLAAPLARGAGVISSLVRADGLVKIPRGSQGLPAGADVTVQLYRSPSDIERTIFTIGSHDICLDILAQYLAEKNRRMASANVGSLGGLAALRKREAHLAGSHLLDPETGEYNIKYVKQYLPGIRIRLVTLVGRQQGLLVKKGNPKSIQSLEDLARPDVTFVNRQRGAGTRVLLDYHLGLLGIDPTEIRGYDQEEYTHLAVAVAVVSARADCGLGIAAAAQALDLEFIRLFDERYDLVIPVEHYQSQLLEPLLMLLEDPKYRQTVGGLPGYDTSQMGKLVAEI